MYTDVLCVHDYVYECYLHIQTSMSVPTPMEGVSTTALILMATTFAHVRTVLLSIWMVTVALVHKVMYSYYCIFVAQLITLQILFGMCYRVMYVYK